MNYQAEGVELAYQNGLLAVDKKASARNWLDDRVDYVKAASYTAWGTFCRATLVLDPNFRRVLLTWPSLTCWEAAEGT